MLVRAIGRPSTLFIGQKKQVIQKRMGNSKLCVVPFCSMSERRISSILDQVAVLTWFGPHISLFYPQICPKFNTYLCLIREEHMIPSYVYFEVENLGGK